jgi:chromosome segregation ATPase
LHDKYPNDRFTIEKDDILCIDCEGRLFSSRTGGSNFEKHLKSKSHREIVASRLAYAAKKSLGDFCLQPVQYDTSLPKGMVTPSTIQCYSLPNVPFGSSTKGQPDLQTQRANMLQYFDTLTSGTLNQEARTKMIEARLVASVDETKGELESVRELVAASEKRSKTQYTKIDEALANSEARNKVQAAEVDQRLKSCQAENNSQLEQLSETVKALETKYEAQVGRVEEVINGDKQTKKELERIEGKMALFQQQNQERHDELKKQIASSEGIDAKIKQCQQESKQYSDQAMNRIHLLERKEVQTALVRTKKDEQFRQMTGQIRSLEQIEEERALAEQNGQDKHHEMEGHLNTMMGKIFLLEEANVKKEQDFIDLESAIQLQSEQFQSQQKKGEELTESITAQLNFHFSKTADQITAMEKASHKRMAEFERSKSAAIQSLEKIFSEKTRVLEEANAEQMELIKRYEAMFPAIIEDASDLREEVAELREEVERLEKEGNERRRQRTRVPQARTRTLGVRFNWNVSRGKSKSRESMASRGSQAL